MGIGRLVQHWPLHDYGIPPARPPRQPACPPRSAWRPPRQYGNAEPDQKDDGTGSMEAVYWGNASGGSMNHGGAGKGPWIQADMEKVFFRHLFSSLPCALGSGCLGGI